MAFFYEKSSTWRYIVAVTKRSKLAMAVFGVTAGVVIPYGLCSGVMALTNPEETPEQLEKLRKGARQDHMVLARMNKERLATLLNEVNPETASESAEVSEKRYKMSLDGKTLGTSAGTSYRD
mmetsp:Transcript_22399/g.27005  ORF Transcript_22399/g.27005 Transcript_22399/m.27005 type:complete len:122 (+) Transcript_22399:139-504(+)|eukprot:CAMPEP_0197849862 /NCGR_PEP_ID=MMETSP1438-20131217/13467_1 /TAXON_ID=1461541 /ORGANISM="Pterosperma sp., Strain CCMP1384" /LENGTH=121 /DNA_ID=CAMNT_0043462737 /DNA_START=139 /DNA_END=504 /DNA_ORIENTATION=-